MGIGYDDSIILYNRYTNSVLETEFYIGTLFENVRVELTEGANISNSGLESANKSVTKIPNENLLKPYLSPEVWQKVPNDDKGDSFTIDTNSFLLIAKKDELNVHLDTSNLLGLIDSSNYRNGFFNHVKGTYGYAYEVKTIDVYNLIPRFEIGGK